MELKMKFDANIPPTSLNQIPELVKEAEGIGFDALWSAETQHSPFLPLALAAEHSDRLQFGTAVAIGFARSPATMAYTSWDLSEASGGRFILGLGTQVKAHVERRFGMKWPDSPVGKLKELIAALRAFWNSWQTGERLNFRGDYYKLTLMSPFFTPGPIKHPDIPIFIAGVNVGLCKLAGEVADGFHAHPYHSERYLREVVIPSISEGAKRSGRDRSNIELSVTSMVATDEGEKEFARSQISFYASTPTYRPVMDLHGWGDLADQLRGLSKRGEWGEMTALISDEVVNTFAVVSSQEELADALLARYGELADRLTLYIPFFPGERNEFWKNTATKIRAA
jgi:probable F420-dependent oxidoreductase